METCKKEQEGGVTKRRGIREGKREKQEEVGEGEGERDAPVPG